MANALQGLWLEELQLERLRYGPGCVAEHLLEAIPSPSSKVFIITGKSIAVGTPLLKQVESLLGDYHSGTFSEVRQHGPVADVEAALERICQESAVDTILSIGGGSPIDTCKTLSYRIHEKTGKFLTHITIPTTLSAAECTAGGGYTNSDGVKTGFMAAGMGVSAIFYDPEFVQYTPKDLWLSTGIKALDHAVESMYHPLASEVPWKALSMWAIGVFFEYLPKAKESHPQDPETSTMLQLAAFASSGLKGKNLKGGMGLSHSLAHALGSPYGIPHGVTSCLTLPYVVKLKAQSSAEDAKQIARLMPVVGGQSSGNSIEDALEVGRRIGELAASLDLKPTNLTEAGVSREDVPVIVQRATRGSEDADYRDAVKRMVEDMF